MTPDRPEREAETQGGGRFASETLSEAEVAALLERNWWGTLATAAEGRPYAVPVVYGWDGERFYVANRPGRKARALEANPAVCLTVVEVEEGGGDWRSVVVEGRAEPVADPRGYLAALKALRRQVGRGGPPPTGADVARLARARVIRIVPERMAGRRKG